MLAHHVVVAVAVAGVAVVAFAVVVAVSVVCHGACISLIRRIVTAVWGLAERRVRRVSKIEIAPVNDLHFSYFMCAGRGGFGIGSLCVCVWNRWRDY